MTKSYKWLGGIGYILLMIPFINLVGYILIGIAWIMAGADVKQGLFKAAGVVLIIIMVLSGAIIGLWLPIIYYLMSGLKFEGPSSIIPQKMFQELFGLFITHSFGPLGLFLTLMGVIGVVGLVGWVLELVSHFRAASVYNVKWFKRAGWMRIITVIVAVIVIASLMFFAFSTAFLTEIPSRIFNLMSIYLSTLVILGILGLISIVFSAISFFSIPEATREPEERYLPPPP